MDIRTKTIATLNGLRRQSAWQVVLRYHEESKHRIGSSEPDADRTGLAAPPDSYRSFKGAPSQQLPRKQKRLDVAAHALFRPGSIAPAPFSIENLGLLLDLAFGSSSLRPKGSGDRAHHAVPLERNLYPVEAYAVASSVSGLTDGLYHYAAQDHALELRCAGKVASAGLWLGLTSVRQRAVWQYGTRAFRYGGLDTGHAIAAVRYAAAALGWSARLVEGIQQEALGVLLGTDRDDEFAGAASEEPELLLELRPKGRGLQTRFPMIATKVWYGSPNPCDPYTACHCSKTEEVSAATRNVRLGAETDSFQPYAIARAPQQSEPKIPAEAIFNEEWCDARVPVPAISRQALFGLLDRVAAKWEGATDFCGFTPSTHLVLFAHNVEGLTQGLYIMPRSEDAAETIRADADPNFDWAREKGGLAHTPLYRLRAGCFRSQARTLFRGLPGTGQSALTIALLSDFATIVLDDPWRYRQLLWEAGAVGQALCFEAHATGFEASGIDRFFDDEIHSLLGLSSIHFQSLYCL
ncbi:MAG: hypothetical protein AAF405_09215, partial [Pseudomonadota bacterium]